VGGERERGREGEGVAFICTVYFIQGYLPLRFTKGEMGNAIKFNFSEHTARLFRILRETTLLNGLTGHFSKRAGLLGPASTDKPLIR